MIKWFRKARRKNIPISGPILQQKACAIAAQMGMEQEFKASTGWLEKFKTRYNIKGKTVIGESGEVHEETVQSWKERLPVLLTGYSPQDILNMDDTKKLYCALFLPNKSFSEAAKQCRGGKQSNERITCVFFVNAAGGKEKPTVIRKSANPRCFKGIKDLLNLPCTYFHQNKAWRMDFDILDKTECSQRESQSVHLLLDNATCHPYNMKGKYPNINNCVFFPLNCTLRLQPLDLGIFQSFKLKYAKLMMTDMVSLIQGSRLTF